jgi:hypothetical protein
MGEEHKPCENHRKQVNGTKTTDFVRESFMLEIRGFSNMVSIVNSVCSLTEYCVSLSVFLDEQHHLSTESPHSSAWEKHCSFVREALMLQATGPFTLLCMVN